jgi:HSP90 family molecular chaperone
VIAELRNSDDDVLAIRVDDNGSGMDIAEVKDTLLWIGQSRNSKESIQRLLEETGKSLIATFGIGLLSCFRVASKILIRTQKGGTGRSFEVAIGGSGERIDLGRLQGDTGGSSVFVFLKEEFHGLRTDEILRHYCRMISLAEIYLFTTSDDKEFELPRRDLYTVIEKSGTRVEGMEFGDGSVEIEGNGYYCRITIPWSKE